MRSVYLLIPLLRERLPTMCCDGNSVFRENLVTGSTELPGVIRRWCSMQAKGGEGEKVECAGASVG